jgi:hypothetical protein
MSHPIALLATHIRAQAVKIKRPEGTDISLPDRVAALIAWMLVVRVDDLVKGR